MVKHNDTPAKLSDPYDVYEVTRGPRKGYYQRSTDAPITVEQYESAMTEQRRLQEARDRASEQVLEGVCGALVVEYGYPTGFGCSLDANHPGKHER